MICFGTRMEPAGLVRANGVRSGTDWWDYVETATFVWRMCGPRAGGSRPCDESPGEATSDCANAARSRSFREVAEGYRLRDLPYHGGSGNCRRAGPEQDGIARDSARVGRRHPDGLHRERPGRQDTAGTFPGIQKQKEGDNFEIWDLSQMPPVLRKLTSKEITSMGRDQKWKHPPTAAGYTSQELGRHHWLSEVGGHRSTARN